MRFTTLNSSEQTLSKKRNKEQEPKQNNSVTQKIFSQLSHESKDPRSDHPSPEQWLSPSEYCTRGHGAPESEKRSSSCQEGWIAARPQNQTARPIHSHYFILARNKEAVLTANFLLQMWVYKASAAGCQKCWSAVFGSNLCLLPPTMKKGIMGGENK